MTINFDEDEPEIGQSWQHSYDPDLDRILCGKLGLQNEIWLGNKCNIGSGPENCHDDIK